MPKKAQIDAWFLSALDTLDQTTHWLWFISHKFTATQYDFTRSDKR